MNRASQLKRAEMLKRRLDPELITSLDTDGKGVDKCEFVVGMMIKLELVDEADVTPYLKQFDALDIDKSGHLTVEDLEVIALNAADRAGMPQKRGKAKLQQVAKSATMARKMAKVAEAEKASTSARRAESGWPSSSLGGMGMAAAVTAAAAAAASTVATGGAKEEEVVVEVEVASEETKKKEAKKAESEKEAAAEESDSELESMSETETVPSAPNKSVPTDQPAQENTADQTVRERRPTTEEFRAWAAAYHPPNNSEVASPAPPQQPTQPRAAPTLIAAGEERPSVKASVSTGAGHDEAAAAAPAETVFTSADGTKLVLVSRGTSVTASGSTLLALPQPSASAPAPSPPTPPEGRHAGSGAQLTQNERRLADERSPRGSYASPRHTSTRRERSSPRRMPGSAGTSAGDSSLSKLGRSMRRRNVADEISLHTSIAFAWGAMDLPREMLHEFFSLALSAVEETAGTDNEGGEEEDGGDRAAEAVHESPRSPVERSPRERDPREERDEIGRPLLPASSSRQHHDHSSRLSSSRGATSSPRASSPGRLITQGADGRPRARI